MNNKFALVIHGGAGVIRKSNMTPALENGYREGLIESLNAGYKVLKAGGTSVDAVIAAIKSLEDYPLFNAGRGSVFSNEGTNEMDASLMDGQNLKAGSVSGVKTIKNPIEVARLVMDKTRHVMLIGTGAEKFVDPSYFWTERRWNQLQKIKNTGESMLDHNIKTEKVENLKPDEIQNIDGLKKEEATNNMIWENKNLGTVGAVALDIYGNIAAGTSTGGMTNKMFGRVGDSPVIGAGTYANNNTCAISCTGTGEYFMRTLGAYDISALMEYTGRSLEEAANYYIYEKLVKIGGDGGLIGIDAKGNIIMPFNTDGMYRGYVKNDGECKIFIFEEDKGKEVINNN